MTSLFSKPPYSRFEEFLAPGINRCAFLCSVLEECKLPFTLIETAGSRHIAISPCSPSPVPCSQLFTAHYDRAADSPGANDNSAAVFILIDAALRFRKSGGNAPLIVFTDHEELDAGRPVQEQGSYGLGVWLKEKSANPEIYVFDCCGAGDTVVISTAADILVKQAEAAGTLSTALMQSRIQKLRTGALEAARRARIEKALLLPTPFSDDAGFFRAGLCAQTISVLPQAEAASFSSFIRMNREQAGGLLYAGEHFAAAKRPETWRSLNGPDDVFARLTPQHWKVVAEFALALVY
jgi:hypothetical protein